MLVDQLLDSVHDAINHFEREGADRRELKVLSWPQKWPDSACGFESYRSFQAEWTAQTVVTMYRSAFRVYHGGKFAYQIIHPNGIFFDELGKRKLRGQVDWEAYLGSI